MGWHLSKAPVTRSLGSLRCLAVMAVFALGACSQSSGPAYPTGAGATTGQGTGQATAPARVPERPVLDPNRPVTLALLVPRTAQAENAARLAEALSNAARLGISELRDPQLRLRVYDTSGRPEIAAAAARKAVAEGANIVLGPLFSASTEAAADVVVPEGLSVISFSTDSAIAGSGVYLSGYTPEAEARRILDYAGSSGRRFVGVFRPRNPYGDAAARGVRDAEAVGAVRIVASTAYERSFKGIEQASQPFAGSVRDAGADAVLLPSGGKELQAVASFLNYHRVDPARVQYLGLGQWNSRASFQEASLRGGWFPAPDPTTMERFAARYAARYGAEPPVLASLGYTAVQVAGQLVAEARRNPGVELFAPEEMTRPTGFRGAYGPIRFRPDGIAEHGLAILEVGPRSFTVRDPAPLGFRAGF